MPISLTISDLHAEFHHLAISMGYVRASEVPAIINALQPKRHDMQQAEPVAEAEEQPAEKFEAPAEQTREQMLTGLEGKKPRGRPRKEQPVPVSADVALEQLEATIEEIKAAPEPAVEHTLADVTQALRNIVKAYNYKEEPARQLFKDFGVAKISELPVEKYAGFIAEAAARCAAAPK